MALTLGLRNRMVFQMILLSHRITLRDIGKFQLATRPWQSLKPLFSARGYFMIFNHDKFHARTHQSDRKGSSKDVEMLKERFSQLEFEVEVFNNLTEREIKKTVAEYARKDHGKCQMFGMAILTHGVEHGKLYAFDGTLHIEGMISQLNYRVGRDSGLL